MNAIELLKKDHQKVAGLFKRYEAAEDGAASEKEELFRMIKRELDVHARIEEEIFYPAAKQAPSEEAKDLVAEAGEEHKQIKTLLAELDGMDADDEQFDAKMTVLKEDVEHHVEEEQDELFPKVRKALGSDRLEELGRQLEARKQALAAAEGADEEDAEVVGARVSQGVRRATVPRSSSDTRDDVMGAISRAGSNGRPRSKSSATSRSRSGSRSRSKTSKRSGSTSRGRSKSTSRGRSKSTSRGRSKSTSRGRSRSSSSGRSGSKSRSKSGRGRR